jgi:chromosome segregation protein
MRLKKIKLAGFKSFVDPTTIPFPDDMTAIVGPNGCGKSNVIDAVRWVLGESSAKNLRGDAMTDVIFNGSTARKPVSQCSVELVFDNSAGRIQGEYAGYNELSVKRIVTKDGQSNYLLNNSKCRRRDVTDLFLGTGLGPRSYAIIEQGMISRLIESKPQELRVFIEEAAGVSKYKERRRETETRIRHTKENLERLADVRSELGAQLEKLQRQASAAKRFKELKQQERSLKGQLAAIRWLKHSKKITALEQAIAQKNTDIEAYVSKQRGEEKDLTEFKEQQQDLKQQLDNIQQQFFKVGTDISRIEQNQIHAKQRRQKIEQEQAALLISIDDHSIHQQQNVEKIEALAQQLDEAEPQNILLEEQLDEAQQHVLACEERASQQQSLWRQQEQQYQHSKQQAQHCHSQIQSLLSMQMRTEQRSNEIQTELNELADDELSSLISQYEKQVAQSQAQLNEQQNKLSEQQTQQQELNSQLKKREQQRLMLVGEMQSLSAQLAALTTLQQQYDAPVDQLEALNSQELDASLWWQTLNVAKGWERAVDRVLQGWQQAIQVNAPAEKLSDFKVYDNLTLLLQARFTRDIPAHSLAAQLGVDSVPHWLTQIICCESQLAAQRQLTQLNAAQSVVTQEGLWLARDWLVTPSLSEDGAQNKGLLQRSSQILRFKQAVMDQKQKIADLDEQLRVCESACQEINEQCQISQQQLEQFRQTLQTDTANLSLYRSQLQQNSGRRGKLLNELQQQQEIANEEQAKLEQLSMQAEEWELKVATLHDEQQHNEQQREENQRRISSARNQVDNVKNQLHLIALKVQGLKSQYTSLQTSQSREQQQLSALHARQQQLQSEYAELALPLEEQSEQLQLLLEQRAELSFSQQDLGEQLSSVENQIAEAEKGQQGVTDKIQAMLTELQSIKLECEGYKVRANGVLEQLQELNQQLKDILDTLPEGADENTWQQQVEKVSGSLGRLGAVNLAAVEEYDIQAERKLHLDTQNDDLASALDTLEQAIRKIDKETRNRFKETFDQVNEDLKMLFPKVFGGGSAYLELTDQDLLETGVTIMARPPGKKNSTIHLLSGGEKALTALSLVFAIFRLNPAPFCLLDEVDAPLDDANVGRFCKLVSEMSKTVQFIYITHNKIAMEMATHLTGVTMSEPGVSRMVAVDVEEAVAIAQA